MKRRNRFWYFAVLTMVILAAIFLCGAANAAESMLVSVNLDGKQLVFKDQDPCLIDEHTYIPIRGVSEALGAKVSWDGETQTATITKNQAVIKLPVSTCTAMVNGKTVSLNAPAIIKNGRMLVPLRFISETLGLKVDWNDAAQTVMLSTPDYQTAMAAKEAKADTSAGTIASRSTTAESAQPEDVMAKISPQFREVKKVFGTNIVFTSRAQLYYYENGVKKEGYDPGVFNIFEAEYGFTLRINLQRFDEKNAGIYKNALKVFYPASYETVYGEILQSIKTDTPVVNKAYDKKDFSCVTTKTDMVVYIGK